MAAKEHIHIHEKVTVFIKDANGKVTSRVIKTPWHEKSLWDKFLTVLGLKKEPGTLNSAGMDALARLYGGDTTVGVGYGPITYVASYTGSIYLYQVITRSWVSPTLTISNEASPWELAYTYTGIYLTDTNLSVRPYHTIGLGPTGSGSVTIVTASGCSWWVEVKLTFSGS